MTTALSGARVVEFGRGVAAPYAGWLLAQYGADVIKVEPPEGDDSRRFGPFPDDVPHPERSGLFLHLNRNKRSVAAHPQRDAALIRGLAAQADVFIEDFPPGRAAEWQWDWPTLAAANPKLVMVSITPFGQSGPYRDYLGSELTLQAVGGPLVSNGHASREPLKLGGHYACCHAGITAALAALLALFRAEKTGQGDWVDLSIYECQAGCRDRRVIQLTIAAYTGLCGGRLADVQRGLGVGVRRCADGYVNITAAGANRLPKLLSMIGETEAATRDPSTLDSDQRETLEAAYRRWLASRNKHDIVQLAQRNGLLAGAFNTIIDLVRDPHYRDRGAWDEVDHPETGPLLYPGRPFKMSAAERAKPQRAPLLDEHGKAIRQATPSPPAVHAKPQPANLPLPLAGIRVAEITVVWAGPHVTQLLAEWGADVVRIEPANRIQPHTRGMERVPTPEQVRTLVARGAPVGFPHNDPGEDPWNRSAAFNSHARNKRSMTCDIMSPEGREAVLRLVAECDVLVENNVPETIDKAGLDWPALAAVNPRLVMLRMPAFALEGPYRNFRAFGLHVEAMVGHTLLRGYPGAGPEVLGESLASDGISGVQGALAVMMALRHRERTGAGQLIELPLTEGFLPVLGEFIMDATMNGRDSPSQGNSHPWHAPHNVYPCMGDDDWIAIDVGGDAQFDALCDMLGTPLAADARFASAARRRQNRTALDAAIAAATRDRDKEELFHRLQAAGVCAAPTHNAVEALADAQLEARGFFEPLPTGNEGAVHRYPGLMFRMMRTPNRLRTPPARLGEHNHDIYCDLLGYSEAAYAALRERGLVAERFPDSIWKPAAKSPSETTSEPRA